MGLEQRQLATNVATHFNWTLIVREPVNTSHSRPTVKSRKHSQTPRSPGCAPSQSPIRQSATDDQYLNGGYWVACVMVGSPDFRPESGGRIKYLGKDHLPALDPIGSHSDTMPLVGPLLEPGLASINVDDRSVRELARHVPATANKVEEIIPGIYPALLDISVARHAPHSNRRRGNHHKAYPVPNGPELKMNTRPLYRIARPKAT